MTFTPKNTKNLTTPWVSAFLYGPAGAGKTSALATFPKPLLLVPKNEQSTTSLMGMDIDYVEITGVDQQFNGKSGEGGMVSVLDYLHNWYKKDPNGFPYQTLGIESMSHYTDLAVQDYETRNAKGQQLWGLLSNHLRWIHSRLRSMEIHVVYTALSDIKGGEDTGGHAVGQPMMSGKMGAFKLPGACDMLGYMEAGAGKNPVYRTYFQRYKCFEARTRIPGMPKEFINFSYDQIEPYLNVTATEDQEEPEQKPAAKQVATGKKK